MGVQFLTLVIGVCMDTIGLASLRDEFSTLLNQYSVHDADEDYDFLNSVVYEGELLDVLQIVVSEFAKTGYSEGYFLDRVKELSSKEKLFNRYGDDTR
jgi:hypothetical protein